MIFNSEIAWTCEHSGRFKHTICPRSSYPFYIVTYYIKCVTATTTWTHSTGKTHVVVVYHVTIVAIGHGLLKKFWPMVIGCVLRTALIIIIDGNPELGADVCSEIGNFTAFKRSIEGANLTSFCKKRPFPHTCATCSEFPSNTRPMGIEEHCSQIKNQICSIL